MRRQWLSGWLILGCLLAALAGCNQIEKDMPAANPAQQPDLEQVKQLIFTQTNQFRKEEGRGELTQNALLARTAQSYAEYMARTDEFSHTADGKEPWERATQQGYDYCAVDENIAYDFNPAGFSTEALAHNLMQMWEQSPPHRKNLLDPNLTEMGVGIARSERTGRYYAVQDFGRPKSAMIQFEIANETDAPVTYTVDGKEYTLRPRSSMKHEVCALPELTVAPSGKSEVLHPKNGGRYVIRPAAEGRYTIEER